MRARSMLPRSDVVVGSGLLLEAALWMGVNAWAAANWWSLYDALAAPRHFYGDLVLQALTQMIPAVPVVIGGVALLRGVRQRRRATQIVITVSFVATAVLNLVLSATSFLAGVFEPDLAGSTRIVLSVASPASAVLAAGAIAALHSRARRRAVPA